MQNQTPTASPPKGVSIEESEDTFAITYRRPSRRALVFLICGSFTTLFSCAFGGLLSGGLCILAGISFYLMMCEMVNRTVFSIHSGSLRITRGPLPRYRAMVFDTQDIAQLYVDSFTASHIRSEDITYANLKLDTLDYQAHQISPNPGLFSRMLPNDDLPQVEWIAAALQRRLGLAG